MEDRKKFLLKKLYYGGEKSLTYDECKELIDILKEELDNIIDKQNKTPDDAIMFTALSMVLFSLNLRMSNLKAGEQICLKN